MDAYTFDRWVKTVSRRPTRRATLRLLGGALLGGVLARSRSESARRPDRHRRAADRRPDPDLRRRRV